MIVVTLPLRTRSEANLREHWTKRAERTKQHRGTTRLVLRAKAAPFLPCTVRLTRISPCELDDDNLRSALKACRDGVADWLGINDRDRRVTWEYGQAKGGVREYAVRVEVWRRAEGTD